MATILTYRLTDRDTGKVKYFARFSRAFHATKCLKNWVIWNRDTANIICEKRSEQS